MHGTRSAVTGSRVNVAILAPTTVSDFIVERSMYGVRGVFGYPGEGYQRPVRRAVMHTGQDRIRPGSSRANRRLHGERACEVRR